MGSEPSKPHKWRLKRTLARNVSFRPIEDEDVKYIWAAYRKGCLKSMGGIFAETGMSGDDFKREFTSEIMANYHAAWTLFAAVPKKGIIPIGLVLGFYSHPDPRFAPFMIVGDMVWFHWASTRNRIEGAVNFFNRIRSEIQMVEYADEADKRFFEMIAQHGIMRRVGTMFNVLPGRQTAVFETKAL